MSLTNKINFPLLGLLAIFIFPIVIAKIFLDFELYQEGVTNKGELVETNINYQHFNQNNPYPKKWQIIYPLPELCEQDCRYQLHILKQSYIALGKYQNRVNLVVAKSINFVQPTLVEIAQFNINNNMMDILKDHIYIVDPLGKFVMRYPLVKGKEQQLNQGKDLLTDLRKMLKLSRIG